VNRAATAVSAVRAVSSAAFSRPLRPLRAVTGPVVRATYVMPRPVVITRYELPVLLNRRRLLGLGFEVGVRVGAFSEFLLDRWRGRLLVSVDPWLAAPRDEYRDVANVDQDRHDALHAETCERLRRFGNRSEVWRLASTEAAPRVLPASADFVYIDARHDYPSVLEDLEHWYPKIRPGGILAGHDYVDGEFAEGVFGVKSAVDEFCSTRRLRVDRTIIDRPWISWIVSVPRTGRTGGGGL
jgi:hypothetical protein